MMLNDSTEDCGHFYMKQTLPGSGVCGLKFDENLQVFLSHEKRWELDEQSRGCVSCQEQKQVGALGIIQISTPTVDGTIQYGSPWDLVRKIRGNLYIYLHG